MFVTPAQGDAVGELARWAEPWRHAFSTSAVVSTVTLFAHVASLVCAGGFSLAADRAVLRAAPAPRKAADEEQAGREYRALATRALALVVVSGLLLFLSDVDAFVHLPTFWLKMGLVALLIGNSRRARRQRRMHARVSITLWFLTLLSGTALMAG